ncbi:glycosyltransferase family 2 protein [Arthrobacter agilis]|uniref:glycosyltransferase family 2 protein n=1 Tax=Arthrobacter agilis TaxID=37921 RepID=UPI0023650B0D|nr:glycosyltransferase family 2 protein [Arthrobacter agilis]WDF32135.1 glycosyltransferase family 2 protein [Arthrobacter agilis]
MRPRDTTAGVVSLRQLVRRATKISRRKTLALVVGVALFLVCLVAAYYRMVVILVPAVILLAAGTVMAAAALDSVVAGARASARASARLLQAAPAVAEGRPDHVFFGTARSWAEDDGLTPAKLVQRLTKLRTIDGRDILVRKVTDGRWDWNDLETALELYRLGGGARKTVIQVLDATVKIRLLQVADLCYRQNLRPDDLLNAATLYRYVYQKMGAGPFKGKKRGEFFLDALSQTGRGDQTLKFQALYDAEKLNPNDLHLFRANAKNPFRHQSHTGEEWLTEINAVYESSGLAPLRLRTGAGPAFTRLSTDPVPAVGSGPLVSIVMPVFRPDHFTDLAVRSALDQSYQNLEIIIVDDGSGDIYAERLDAWEGMDPRITVIRNTPNSGAYTSRNIGYTAATGEYLTIFDGDDWQHPQKIELLVDAAVRQPDDRLVSSPWARADQDLMFHYRGWRGAYITPAHVSAMFPISVIRERLGFWDTVRKAADTEFILRYQLLVNREEPLEVTAAPLTLSLVGSSNLSVDDFRLGYRSPDRVAYRASYEHWHRKIEAGDHNGYLASDPEARAFQAPSTFLPVRSGSRELDVVVVGDFSAPGPAADRMTRTIADARALGADVGVMHAPSIVNTASIDTSFPPSVMQEFEEGSLTRVEITDSVTAGTVHIFDPTAFEFRRHLQSGQSADEVVVHAFAAPYDRSNRVQRYSVGAVTRNVREVFGGPVRWMAGDAKIFDAIGKTLASASDLQLAANSDDVTDDQRAIAQHETADHMTTGNGTR